MSTVMLINPAQAYPPLPAKSRVVRGADVYTILAPIGTGGFLQVYRAATSSGLHLAVKVAAGAVAQQKLLRDAYITSILSRVSLNVWPLEILEDAHLELPLEAGGSHPFGLPTTAGGVELTIATQRDFGSFGMTLQDALDQGHFRSFEQGAQACVFSLTEQLAVFSQILETLEPVHEHQQLGYLHGDLSPANIILVPGSKTVLLIDFCDAQKLVGGQSEAIARQDFAYNPVYLSPEVRDFVGSDAKSLRLSRASDVYCLGLILYALLFEQLTPRSVAHVGVLARNRTLQWQRQGLLNKVLARALVALFDDLLATDPLQRIANLAELRARLDDLRELLLAFQSAALNDMASCEKAYARCAIYRSTGKAAPLVFGNPFVTTELAAMCFIADVIRHTHSAEGLHAVNHLWPKPIIKLLRALPAELVASLCLRLRTLIDAAPTTALLAFDLLPTNLFALTGDTTWALLSARLADRWFHEMILDGYFASDASVLLFRDVALGKVEGINTAELPQMEEEESFCLLGQWPRAVLLAIAADLRAGFRLSANARAARVFEEVAAAQQRRIKVSVKGEGSQ